jgi:predicted nucleotidyltransferase
VHFLKILEKEHILTSKKDANLKKYGLQHNKRAYALLTLLDVEKFEKLPLLRKTAVNKYLNALPPVIFAVVFGSTAENSYRNDSDIDILLVTYKRTDTKNAEKEADIHSSIRIHTFQIEYEAFIKELKLKEEKVIQAAIETGFPIINHIRYYETIMPSPWI